MKNTYRNTAILMVSIIVVLFVGIGSRVVHTGFPVFDEYLGDALYAVLFYLLLSLVWERGTPFAKAFIIMILMLAIETFQLTGIALRFRSSIHLSLRLLSIALGTRFGWLDIVAYLVGILGVYLLDRRKFFMGISMDSRLRGNDTGVC